MGAMHLSRRDFENSTPDEFFAVHQAWAAERDRRERNGWEQVRTLALCILQPHSTRVLRPRDILTFPWEQPAAGKGPAPLTPEEQAGRYRAALLRYGFTSSSPSSDGQESTVPN